MLIVTITRADEPREGEGYKRDRELFRFETTDLNIPALVRATLAAAGGPRTPMQESLLSALRTAVLHIPEEGHERALEHLRNVIDEAETDIPF